MILLAVIPYRAAVARAVLCTKDCLEVVQFQLLFALTIPITITNNQNNTYRTLLQTNNSQCTTLPKAMVSGTFQALQSYKLSDIVFGGRFQPCMSQQNGKIYVDVDKFHTILPPNENSVHRYSMYNGGYNHVMQPSLSYLPTFFRSPNPRTMHTMGMGGTGHGEGGSGNLDDGSPNNSSHGFSFRGRRTRIRTPSSFFKSRQARGY